MSSIKNITVVSDSSAEDYIPRAVGGGSDVPSAVFRATLDLILKHSADMYRIILHLMCQKYSINEDEALTFISEHPAFKDMIVNPKLHSLTYLTQSDISEAVSNGFLPPSEPSVSAPAPTASPASPAKKVVIRRKKSSTETTPVQSPTLSPAQIPVPNAPKKIVRIRKPASTAVPSDNVVIQVANDLQDTLVVSSK